MYIGLTIIDLPHHVIQFYRKMKTHSFNIPIFDFKVKLIQIEDKKDLSSLEKHKWLKNMDNENKEEIFTKIKLQ